MFYTARADMGEAHTGRTSISTSKHVPLKIEVFPHRRGIRVQLSLLTEEETSWTFDLLAPDLPDHVCSARDRGERACLAGRRGENCPLECKGQRKFLLDSLPHVLGVRGVAISGLLVGLSGVFSSERKCRRCS